LADEIISPDPVITTAALINPTVACIATNGNGVGIGSGVLFNQKWAYSYSGANSYAGVPANTTALSPFSAVLTPNGTRRHIQVPYSTDPGCKFIVLWRSLASDGYATVRTYTDNIGGDDAFVYPNNPAGGTLDVMIDGTGLSTFFDDVPGFINRSSGVTSVSRQIGSGLVHYYTVNDNVTTGPITPVPDIKSSKTPARSTTPPLAPIERPTAYETDIDIDETAPLSADAQAGYWAFRVTGTYQDGTESRSTTQTAPVLFSGTKKAGLNNIPIWPNVGSVTCLYRTVYAAIYEPFEPLELGTPDFSAANSRKVAFILDNVATSAIFPFGVSLVGGERATNNLPPGAEEELGPDLESTITPDDVDDSNQTLLHDPPVELTMDLTQLRNKVFVKGKGTIMAGDAAIGDRSLRVLDVSPFSPTGGKVATGHLVLDYKGLTASTGAASITLSNALTQPILQADWKFGGGTPVRPVLIVEDLESQAFFSFIEVDDDGQPSDGVHEYMLVDDKLSTQLQMYNAGLAELRAAWPIRDVSYSTRDPKSRKGRTVHFDLSDPPIFGDFVITDVSIDQYYDESEELQPRYNVSATTVGRITLHDYLKMIGAPREEFSGFGGVIDTAIEVNAGANSVFPNTQYGRVSSNGSLPDFMEVGCTSSTSTMTFDETEIPFISSSAGSGRDRSWATAATTTGVNTQAHVSFTGVDLRLDFNVDCWVHIKTPKSLDDLIIFVGGYPLLTNLTQANTSNNSSQWGLRYSNQTLAGAPNNFNFKDTGWTLTFRPVGASEPAANFYITTIAPSTEYLIRLQTQMTGKDANTTRVRATVNGVMREVSYAEAFVAGQPRMPVAGVAETQNYVLRTCVLHTAATGQPIRKVNFSRMSVNYGVAWTD